jgi:uncharacterized phage infection (PIP) family protein YhgE
MSSLITIIQPTECIGNSLVTLNKNFTNLNDSLDQAYNTLASLNESLRTLATGLTAVETAFAQISASQN